MKKGSDIAACRAYRKLAAQLQGSQDPDVNGVLHRVYDWLIVTGPLASSKHLRLEAAFCCLSDAYFRFAEYTADNGITDWHKAISDRAYFNRTGDQPNDWLDAQQSFANEVIDWSITKAAVGALAAARRSPDPVRIRVAGL